MGTEYDGSEPSRRRIPAHQPDWTDRSDSDPGITILELIALVIGVLAFMATAWWIASRARRRRGKLQK